MKGKLYFVHGYYSFQNQNVNIIENKKVSKDRIILMRNDINNVYNVQIEDISIDNQEYLPLMGDYVIYDGNKIESANNNQTAQMYNMLGESLRYAIINSELYLSEYKEGPKMITAENIKSYHINVGHGNCSLIVFQEKGEYKAWMIDCSVKDMTNQHNYIDNLKKCLGDLYRKYKITKISKLLITHPHYDHINGIHYLINSGMLDSETEVWFNLHLTWNFKPCLNLLSRLMYTKVKFIDPIISNSTNNIKVLYPNKSYANITSIPNNDINNASVLYQICFNDISMIFPGDIETEGWDIVKCSSYLNGTTYYCISHHGSLNGHLRNNCFNGFPISTVQKCTRKTRCQILMGRDGAYSGIFSNVVLTDFKGTIERTDQVSSYIELDWVSGKINKV